MTDLHARSAQARSSADTAPVVLVGAPSPLRSAVAAQLRAAATPLACLDSPGRLTRALTAPPAAGAAGTAGFGAAGFRGAVVVLATVPRPPGLASGLLRHGRTAALAAGFERAVLAARTAGASRVVVLSTAFRYDDDGGLPIEAGRPDLTAAETAHAAAAEEAALLFSRLGGESVVLRLGWACGEQEAITRRVLSAARRGWRLIDADPGSWVSLVAEADAARAVRPSLTVPPGTYPLTDGCPVTVGELNARLEEATRQRLHSLDDPRWGGQGALFGRSRQITDTAFALLTGWQPGPTAAADQLAAMLR